LADEIGLSTSIGEWVLREACKQNKAWQEAGLPPVRVAVNITSQQLRQFDFVERVKAILLETKLRPEYLELELTENSIINNRISIKDINILKEMGVQFAVDDFGTGYSSLNYLRNIPLDRLKIDSSFVQNIQINHGDEVIIQAIIDMAKGLNMEILAEGVETRKQLNFLKSKECKNVQGFYFSKPLSVTDLTEILKDSSKIDNLLMPHTKEKESQ
jgi:diguanylate cyclase